MLFTVYQITNLLNGKIYVGMHQTSNIEDGYMSSSSIVKAAIKKYGIENFKKEILNVFDNFEEMAAREKQIVDEAFVLRADTYNVKTGGIGSFSHINSDSAYLDSKRKGGQSLVYRLNTDKEFRENYADASAARLKKHGVTFQGRKHSDESKHRQKQAMLGKGLASANSQYGTCWIYKPNCGNEKILAKDLESYLKDNWIKGRKMNMGS